MMDILPESEFSTIKFLQLHLTHVDDTKYVLGLPGLERLKANNFLEGNIILVMSLYTGEEIADEVLKELYGNPNRKCYLV